MSSKTVLYEANKIGLTLPARTCSTESSLTYYSCQNLESIYDWRRESMWIVHAHLSKENNAKGQWVHWLRTNLYSNQDDSSFRSNADISEIDFLEFCYKSKITFMSWNSVQSKKLYSILQWIFMSLSPLILSLIHI